MLQGQYIDTRNERYLHVKRVRSICSYKDLHVGVKKGSESVAVTRNTVLTGACPDFRPCPAPDTMHAGKSCGQVTQSLETNFRYHHG